MQTLELTSVAAWHDWLARHHGDTPEIWLVFFKKHTGRRSIPYEAAVEEALCFGWIDSIKRRLDDARYAFKFTPRKARSHWSASNKRRIARLQAQQRLQPAGQAVLRAAQANGWWDKTPDAEQEAIMPDELQAQLEAHAAARAGYSALSAAQQRQYRLWIGSAKRPATRQKRALEARARLERGEKLGMK